MDSFRSWKSPILMPKRTSERQDSEDGLYLTATARYRLLSEWLEKKFNMLIKHGLL